ncbi:MAG: hypothetical protein RBT49_15575 [Bacteroidales bacterium]|nr:hypothetical protein [Bacteroidales bacterium]
MKKRAKIFDDQPWYVNHASPMSKWLFNFCFLGFRVSEKFGYIWLVCFNPFSVILLLAEIAALALVWFLSK